MKGRRPAETDGARKYVYRKQVCVVGRGCSSWVMSLTTVNREIVLSAATKVITSNEIMETLTVVKVEATVVTQEADPVTITTKGEETKTETETTTDKIETDKIDTDKTIKTKIMATPNADTTPATKSNAEKTRHTRMKQTMKAMMDKTLTF
jgi:hypothetical protein